VAVLSLLVFLDIVNSISSWIRIKVLPGRKCSLNEKFGMRAQKEISSKRIKPIISMDKERTIRKSDQKYKGEE